MENHAPVTILAILAAMARCLNENMANVKLAPMPVVVNPALTSPTSSVNS